jgi:hypothetical protein
MEDTVFIRLLRQVLAARQVLPQQPARHHARRLHAGPTGLRKDGSWAGGNGLAC